MNASTFIGLDGFVLELDNPSPRIMCGAGSPPQTWGANLILQKWVKTISEESTERSLSEMHRMKISY